MIVSYLDVKAGFTLDNPDDLQYKRAMLHRHQFGEVSAKAASTLRQNTDGEDHTDAVIGVTRAIDTYLLCYGLNRGDFDSMQKNYAQAREYVYNWCFWTEANHKFQPQSVMDETEGEFPLSLCQARPCLP